MSSEILRTIKRKAVATYNNQRIRCYCKSHKSYKSYGAKGIRVEYTFGEFFRWFVDNWSHYCTLLYPSIGRIDHSKGYSLDNIQAIERNENTAERNRRVASVPTVVLCRRTHEVVFIGNSRTSAAEFAKVQLRIVMKELRALAEGKDPSINYTKTNGYYFKDHEKT